MNPSAASGSWQNYKDYNCISSTCFSEIKT